VAPYGYEIDSTAEISGGHIISSWNKILSETSSFNIQFYYDRTERKDHLLEDQRDTFDIDFQHQFRIGGAHDILWGLGYRYIDSQVTAHRAPASGLYTYKLTPTDHKFKLFTGFIQDRISLADGQGELTLGAKLEHNEFTDFEWQPSLRLLWSINEKSTVWGAASRTVRTPSLAELSGEANAAGFPVSIPGAPGAPPEMTTMLMRLMANDDIDEERTYSYELGYRHQFGDHLFFDMTAFYNQYKGVTAGKLDAAPFAETFPPTYVVMPLYLDNAADVDAYGVEISCSWAIFDWWKVTGGLTWFDMDRDDNGSIESSTGFGEGQQAEYQLSLISYVDLSRHFEINGAYYYTNSYSFENDLSDVSIAAYHRLDVNIVWKPTDHLRISVGGRNLLDNYHAEFYSDMDGLRATEIPRSFYASLEWSF